MLILAHSRSLYYLLLLQVLHTAVAELLVLVEAGRQGSFLFGKFCSLSSLLELFSHLFTVEQD